METDAFRVCVEMRGVEISCGRNYSAARPLGAGTMGPMITIRAGRPGDRDAAFDVGAADLG
jgi:hypothetical protein